MELILHSLKECLCDCRVLIVIYACLFVQVGDLQIEPPLAGSDFAYSLEKLVEVVLAEALVQLEPLIVERESLDYKLRKSLGCPDPKLCSLRAIDPVTH